ncbi:MAG: DUF1153 domain-containing protein [Pseudomonadota bacterium]|uniref:DUF1153 domain-containing protein n=1 Tax=Roseovarius TaxID=74030 RepID=UPI0022A806D1|nr:DUF1153 domain-containing protein [Roseovarius sp. EGI FJ00037]MCZ0811016.1 DUF1153 domain-containing protein [Roseovarius sp. EGI FJ00037]
MFLKKTNGKRTVKLPDGSVMSCVDLPAPDTARWTAARKLAVVRGVAHGLIEKDAALERYGLSEAEFLEWVKGAGEGGLSGLRATLRKKRYTTLD